MPNDPFEPYKNPDGTYSGVKFLAALSGLSEGEVRQTWVWVKSEKRRKCECVQDLHHTCIHEIE